MRRLHLPTLTQWGCAHQWKTTTTRSGEDDVVRVRYLSCGRCGLKVKTEERLAVPWSEGDLLVQVKALLPEEQAVVLRDQGITELSLAGLNARLAPYGYAIPTSNGRNSRHMVTCLSDDGRVERCGLFELKWILPTLPGDMNSEEVKGNVAGS